MSSTLEAGDGDDARTPSDALEDALGMADRERRERMWRLRRQVHEHDLSAWLDDVVETVDEVRRSTDARDGVVSGGRSPVAGR